MVITVERNASIPIPPHHATGSRMDPNEGVSETPFLTGIPGVRWRWQVVQSEHSTRYRLARFLQRSLLRGFPVFLAASRGLPLFSDSRIVRESPPVPRLPQPGWKPSHLGCPSVGFTNPSELRPVGNNMFRRPVGAALRPEESGLRFVLFYLHRSPVVDTSHT